MCSVGIVDWSSPVKIKVPLGEDAARFGRRRVLTGLSWTSGMGIMAVKGGQSTFAIETDAIAELVQRMRELRRKVFLPFVVGFVIVGHLGIAAHAFGYWSVLGIIYDDHYRVNFLTVALAFFLPSSPIIGLGIATYVRRRDKVRKEWQNAYLARGLDLDWLSSTADRFS
jgi:hypothetical protein